MKKALDKRICDAVEGASNTETYREFIRNSEESFEMDKADIDSMDDKSLSNYIEFLDYLWSK